MKTKYTKKQITEAIAYWEKQLKKMDESENSDGKYLYVTKSNPSFVGSVRKIGASGVKKLEDPYQSESINTKLTRYNTCVPVNWETAYVIKILPAAYAKYDYDIRNLESELFAAVVDAGGKRYGTRELFDISDDKIEIVVNTFIEQHPGLFMV